MTKIATRTAIVGIATAIAGCFSAPERAVRSVGAHPPEPGTGAHAPERAGQPAAGRAAYVRLVIGGPRQVQFIPSSTKAIGLAVRSVAGRNLILSATCGAVPGCYDSTLERVVVGYTLGQTTVVTLVLAIETMPVQAAVLQAYAYRTKSNLVLANTPATAGASSSVLLRPGETATGDIEMAGLVGPPLVTSVIPLMAAEGQALILTGDPGIDPFTVEFGTSSATVSLQTTTGTVMTELPARALDGPLRFSNEFGSTTFGTPLTVLKAIALPQATYDLAPDGQESITVTTLATNSSNQAFATASVAWQVVEAPADTNQKEDESATPRPELEPPEFEFTSILTGEATRADSVGIPDMPGTVTLYGRDPGKFALTISNGKLEASATITVKSR